MSDHSFDPQIAKMVGVNSAIIFKHIVFWIAKNKADRRNCFDGEYWTYTSIKALDELFCYLTSRQIHHAIEKLLEADLLKKGNYNEIKTDRTLWYAVGNMGKQILQKCKMDFTPLEEPTYKNVKCLYKTDKSTDKSRELQPAKLIDEHWQPTADDIAYLQEKRPHLDLRETVDSFKFYWLSAPPSKAKKRNWSLAFKQWVLREKPPATKPRKQSFDDVQAQRRASITAMIEAQENQEKEWKPQTPDLLLPC